MKRNLVHIINSTTLCLLAGSAIGQTSTFDQGTIDRQRNRLDHSSLAPTTNGWLNDSQTPKFWAWELRSSTNDTYKHPNMQRWIQHQLWGSSISGSSINTTSLDSQAGQIATEIVTRYNSLGNNAIADGEYAICLLNFNNLDLHDHPDDDLDDSVILWNPKTNSVDALAEPWANFISNTETPARASVWRSNGVALADEVIEYLTDKIVSEVETHIPSFPAPIRLFFDEERGRQHGANNLDNLGAIEAVTSDTSRFIFEQMFGNYDLWDSTPTTTKALEVFTNAPNAFMPGWNTAATVYRPDDHAEIPQYTASNYSHQRPHFDFEFYPMYNLYNGILNTSTDGAIEAAIAHPLTDLSWDSPKWSNYNTSIYFSTAYPKISHSPQGATHATWAPHREYGWTQAAHLGSGSIQSPTLYPPSDSHEMELKQDFYPDPGINITDQSEREARAWLRYSRMQLDHILFSFPELDALSFTAPRHIAPWVTRVGTLVYRPSMGNDINITTKENVRDIVALCKAKGINEILFWGNPDAEFYTTTGDCNDGTTIETKSQHNWDSTNDLLSQVYEYTLNDVWLSAESRWIGANDTKSLTFSEEHTLDFSPSVGPNGSSVQFVAEFDIGSITSLGDQYTFVCEVLDGAGPWANASYTLEIYNFKSNSYQTISQTPEEQYSNSTRKAEFIDTDSNNYADDYTRTFDDQAQLAVDSVVYDRKKINVWKDISLPIGAGLPKHYSVSGKMKLKLTVAHSELLPAGETADPLRVDLVQLYESECENNNISAPPEAIYGDFTDDGLIDTQDFIRFMQEMSQSSSTELDLNHDGIIDARDLATLIDLSTEN